MSPRDAGPMTVAARPGAVTRALAVWVVALALGPGAASAGVSLPAGFTQQVYVSGRGFARGVERGAPGFPVATTLGFDAAGYLYLARSGARYGAGQAEELLSRVYRIPPGGAQLRPDNEATYVHGPPLRNPEVGAVVGHDVFLTTFDPERELGVVYRVGDGHAVLFAGGTPPSGSAPALKQPEGVVMDPAGNVYVADRARGRVVKLDPAGKVLDPQCAGLTVPRARMLALDPTGALWVAGDGDAQAPWQDGTGQIWRIGPDGSARLVFDGPHAAAIAPGPDGALFVADRQTGMLSVLAPDGQRTPFAGFTDGSVPRGLAVAPVTAETRRAGIAGDLFVVTFALRTWYVNEVVRISGPFGGLGRR